MSTATKTPETDARTVQAMLHRGAGRESEARALGVDTASAGGVLATDDFVDRLNVVKAPLELPTRPVRPEKGTAFIPTVETLPTVTLEGLDDSSSENSITFSQVALDDTVRRELFFLASQQLLSDAEALEQKLLQVAGRAFAASTNNLLLTGSGTDQVLGVTNDSDVPTQAISNTDTGTILDSIHQAIENLGDGYRAGPGLAVAMGAAEYRTLRSLKDSNNQPVGLIEFRPFGGSSVPFLGPFRVVIDDSTPDGELVFGDWRTGYEWAQVRDLALSLGQSEGAHFENFQRPIRLWDEVDGEPAQAADAFVRATGLDTSTS
jgi:HK97 family phage major capsid protein